MGQEEARYTVPEEAFPWRLPRVRRGRDAIAGWVATVWVAPQDGTPVVVKVELGWEDITDPKSVPIPKGGITQRMLRDIPLSEALEAERGVIRTVAKRTGWGSIAYTRKGLAKSPKRPGRRGHPDIYYAMVADVYARAKKNPRQAVARAFKVSPERATSLIYTARNKKGFLTPAPKQGATGASTITDKAKKVLRKGK